MAQEYEVLYDWEPENAEDLGLFAGESVFILEKHDHGWWLGSIERDGNLVKGYFPRNYVKEKPPSINAPKPPPRPSTGLSSTSAKLDHNEVGKVSDAFGRLSTDDRKESIRVPRGPTFSLRSISAFDELSDKGYAVEFQPSKELSKLGSIAVKIGDQVELQCTASIWDGASTVIKEYARGVVKFVVGAKQVVPGLESAVQSLKVGQTASITCAPQQAYGQAGSPPVVPPNAYIIFNVQLLSISVPTSASSSPEGPAAFFGSGIESRRSAAANADNRRSTRLVLVQKESA